MNYEIKKITKKRNGNFNLYLADYSEEKIQIHQEVMYRYGIYKLHEIDDSQLLDILQENENLLAKDYALKSLGYSAKTYNELKNKLILKRFSNNAVEYALDFIEEKNLIDEEKIAQDLVESKYKKKRYSKRKIQMDLRHKGVSREIISGLIEDIDDELEYENAMFYAEKKLRSLRNLDLYDTKKKLRSTLAYRGFDYEIINKVIRTIVENIDEVE